MVNIVPAGIAGGGWTQAPMGSDINQRIAEALMLQTMKPQEIKSPWQGAAEMSNAAVAGLMYRKAMNNQAGMAQAIGSMAFPGATPAPTSGGGAGGIGGFLGGILGGGNSAAAAPPPQQTASVAPPDAAPVNPNYGGGAPAGAEIKAKIASALAGQQSPEVASDGQPAPVPPADVPQAAPGQIKGQLAFNGQNFDYGSGGAGRGSIPPGDYPITPDTVGPWGQAHGAIGINNNSIPDSRIGATRQGIELHAGTNPDLITKGCIAIAGNQWPQFRQQVMAKIQSGEKLSLHVGPDGAAITDGNGKAVGAAPTQQVAQNAATSIPGQPGSVLQYAPLGPASSTRGSYFGDAPGVHDPMNGSTTASGIPTSQPGIALPNRATMGQNFQVTAPNGQTAVLPQTDIGPAMRTGRGVDITAGALPKLGYTPGNFPTDSQFQVQPVVPLPPPRPQAPTQLASGPGAQVASIDPNFVPKMPPQGAPAPGAPNDPFPAAPPVRGGQPQPMPQPPAQQFPPPQQSIPLPPPRPVEGPPGYMSMPPAGPNGTLGGNQVPVAPPGPPPTPPGPPQGQQSAIPAPYQIAQNGGVPPMPGQQPQMPSQQQVVNPYLQMIDGRIAQMQGVYQQLLRAGNYPAAQWIAQQAAQLQMQKLQLMTPQIQKSAPGEAITAGQYGPDGQYHITPIYQNQNGLLTPEGRNFAADANQSGNTSLNPLLGRGQVGSLNGASVFNELGRRGAASPGGTPGFAAQVNQNRATMDAQVKGAKDFATGQQGNTVRSFSVAMDHLNVLKDVSAALANGDTKVANALWNELGRQTGKSEPLTMDAVKTIVNDELTKAILASNGALGDREEMAAHIATSNSPQQIADVIGKGYMPLMVGQLHGFQNQYKFATKKNDFRDMLSPSVSKLMGAPQPGEIVKGYQFKGGNPADQNSWQRAQ